MKKEKKTTKTTLKKEQFLEALEKSMGIISQAAKKIGIDRTTPYRWANEDEEFKEKINEVQNIVVDFGETKLYNLVEKENVTATMYLLNCKGGNRGWGTKSEIDITSDKKPIVLNIGNGVKPNE